MKITAPELNVFIPPIVDAKDIPVGTVFSGSVKDISGNYTGFFLKVQYHILFLSGNTMMFFGAGSKAYRAVSNYRAWDSELIIRAIEVAEATGAAALNPFMTPEATVAATEPTVINITVNARPCVVGDSSLPYESIVALAQMEGTPTVLYHLREGEATRRLGVLKPGMAIVIEEGLVFDVAHTDNA